MSKIIDLGNGYGRLEGYGSPYASLTFPLTMHEVRRLHAMEVISDDEARDILTEMGYDLPTVKWTVAVDKVSTEQWKERVHGLGTI